MTHELFQPAADGLAYLYDLIADDAPTDEAVSRARVLRARHPQLAVDVVWERDAVDDRPQYRLLLRHPVHGTVSLAVAPPNDVPFAVLGAQRWRDSDLVRVNGRALWLYEAMLAIDVVWNHAPILERIVDACLIREALEREPIEVGDDELQRAVDDFRAERGLLTPEATDAWLVERGLSLAALEGLVEQQLAMTALRERVAGARAEGVFRADPSRFDSVALVVFAAADDGEARRLASAVREGASLFEIAEHTLAQRPEAARAARACVFETTQRGRVAPLDDQPDVGGGAVLAARVDGAGPYVVAVRAITPARWDDATRRAIEDELFADWLAEARAGADVQWNWGRAEDRE